jgi:hypothetical protein
VERLQGVAASFDRCRAVRYQQGMARELAQSRGTQAFLQVGRWREGWRAMQNPACDITGQVCCCSMAQPKMHRA